MIDEKLLEKLSKHSESEVRELVQAYLLIMSDPCSEFYSALTHGSRFLSEQVKNKKLDMDDPYTKGLIVLLEKGDKIYNSIQRGRSETNPEEKDAEKEKKLSKNSAVAV